jgi:hypothetical protein
MNHDDKVKIIQFLRPDAQFVLRGDEIEWCDTVQKQPTQKEIEDAKDAYLAKVQAEKSEALSKRQSILDRLGITAEEAALLLK